MQPSLSLRALRRSILPVLVAALPSVGRASLSYTLSRVDSQNQPGFVTAQGLSDSGQVLVSTEDDTNFPDRGILGEYTWQNGHKRQLPVGITAINGKGAVAGTTDGRNGVVISTAGQTTKLAGPSDAVDGIGVNDLNNSNQVVGYENPTADHGQRPLYWNHGKLDVLGAFGGESAVAVRINRSAQILMNIADGTDGNHADALLWQDGVTQPIKAAGGLSTYATDLNDAGEAVGIYGTWSVGITAFSWQKGVMQKLAPLPGDLFAEATAVNDAGEIVGTSWSGPRSSRPVIWKGGQVIDLLPTIKNGYADWTNFDPMQINHAGVISGIGTLNGLQPANQPQQRAFVLEPNQLPVAAPLPGPVWMACTGAPLLVWQLRRRRVRAA